jgi:hypothetical protein
VRAILPRGINNKKIFIEIAPGFQKFGKRFQFVLREAVGLNFKGRKVTVNVHGSKRGLLDIMFWF